jgi:hypothetical protein
MQKRLLLDGCSFTYGLGLNPNETLEHHFIESGYEVVNLSRPGKSNQAIALDIYNHDQEFDLVVVGWTFSSRWYLQYNSHNIDLMPSRQHIELPYTLDANDIEQSYVDLHRSLYSFFDVAHWNRASDMLIDCTHAHLNSQNKQVIFFSWESRSAACPIYYPHVNKLDRLSDGHLNAGGTTKLFDKLTSIIEQ